MSWTALFERAERFEVDEAAVLEALAERRRTGRTDDEPEGDPP